MTDDNSGKLYLKGIIMKGIGGFYYVSTANGLFECKAKGVFRKKEITPVPGDYVSIAVIDESKRIGNIEDIEPRKNCLIRPAVANIDQLLLVTAVKSPLPDLLLLDKLLLTAEMKGIDAIICLNKIDLDTGDDSQKIRESYERAGYPVVLASAVTEAGMDQLKEKLMGKISAFSGQSGVGKSTLLNSLKDVRVMETAEISRRTERGRHTTRHVEIFEIPGNGYVVDTPGFSSFELSDISCANLERYYPEYSGYLGNCRFKGCSHISEPDCAVKEALEKGQINRDRYDRYCELYGILKSIRKVW